MNDLMVVANAELFGKRFQIYGSFDKPLFLAKDVAEWIEHSDVSTMLRSVDDDEKETNIVCTLGGNQQSWFLTEDGLYEVLMLSRKPIAKQFKRGVKQILHDYRTKGIAATPQTIDAILNDPEFGIRLLTELKEERAKRKCEEEKRLAAEQEVKQLAPDAEYTRRVISADNLHTINSAAVHLGISAIRLNRFPEDAGWIYRQGGNIYPSAKIRGKGYCDFHIVPYAYDEDGSIKTREHLKWTESGRRAIIELWEKHN